MSPEPAMSSSLKSCGVTSSSNQLSSAIVPFRNSVLASGIVSVCAWFFHFQNFFIGIFLLSVASVIAMAGTKVLMSPVSMMMIHNPMTVAFGDSGEMQKAIDMLASVKDFTYNF